MVYGLHGRSWLKCESGGGGKVLNCLHVDFKVPLSTLTLL